LCFALIKVFSLFGKKFVSLLEFFLFVYCIDIDVAEPFDLAAKLGDLLLDLVPVDVGVLKILISISQVDLQFFCNSLGQVFVLNAELTEI